MPQRKGRGPIRLDDSQLAALSIVRKRQTDLENAEAELQSKIEQLEETFTVEQRGALRSAVWAARDLGVPANRLKPVLGITNHNEFLKWLEGYVPPAPLPRDEGFGDWFYVVIPPTGDSPERIHLTRFLKWDLDVTLWFDGDWEQEGEFPADLMHAVQGIRATVPENDVKPDLKVAEAWGRLYAEIENRLKGESE